jgi:hypothetical protein
MTTGFYCAEILWNYIDYWLMKNTKALFNVFLGSSMLTWHPVFNKKKLQFDLFLIFLLTNTKYHDSIKKSQKKKYYIELWYFQVGLFLILRNYIYI